LIARLVRGSRKKRVSTAPASSQATLTAVMITKSTAILTAMSNTSRSCISTKPENSAAMAA